MQEIVQKKSFGSVKLFWLNKENLDNALKEIAGKIGEENKNVNKIILFGSHAENRATAFSDVDILIVAGKENRKFFERGKDYFEYFSELGLSTDIFVYTEEELENTNFIRTKKYKVLFSR